MKIFSAKWICVFWLFPNIFFGQGFTIDVQHYGIEEGLSHRNVHFAHQDKRGLMWFGTDYGLNRFDGYNFKWITKEKHGLQSNKIEKALEDKDGLMWLMYGSTMVYADRSPYVEGIDIFNPETEEVTPFETFFKDKPKLSPKNIHSFTQKDKGELTFLTKDSQLVTYNEKNGFDSVPLQNQYYFIKGFHWSANGYFWMNARKENNPDSQVFVIALNQKGEEVYAIPVAKEFRVVFFYKSKTSPNEKWISLVHNHVHSIFQFEEATPQGQVVSNSDGSLFTKLNLDFIHFDKIAGYTDDDNHSWFFSNDGFYLLDKNLEQVHQLNDQYPDIAYAYHIYIDRQGKTWVSTQFGVYLITLKPNHFTKILNQKNEVFPVRGLALDDDNGLWVVNESIPNLWKASLSADKKNISKVETSNNPIDGERLFFGGRHYPLHKSKSGDIIYSPGKYYLKKINPDNYFSHTYRSVDTTLSIGDTWSIFMDSQNKIWTGNSNGYIGFTEKDSIHYFPLLEASVADLLIYQFIENGQTLWVVSEAGLFLLDKPSRKINERYWSGGNGKYKLPFDKLYHAFQDSEYSFWLGTSGNGLIHFNIKTGEYEQFTKADGLSNNVIYAVYPDDYNNLWLTSDYGIMRFNKTTRQVKSYLTKDGITHNEFNRISHHQSGDGTLFFGGLNGVTAFHPKDFQSDSIIANTPLIISNFQQFVGDENKLTDKTNELLIQNKIVLAPNDPFFRLEFALLTFEDADKVHYAYQIEGIDQDWIYQKENYIRINRLQYGNHTLHIKGQSSTGQWSDNKLNLNVLVLKPFYLQTWFLIVAGLIFLISGPLVFKWRTSQLIKQKAKLEEEVAMRTETIREQAEELKSLERLKSRFFANVSHELRTPLTLLLGPINSLLKRRREDETDRKLLQFAQRNGQQLKKLINEILDLSKLEDNKLQVEEEPVQFYEYIKDQSAQFHSFGASEQVHFEVDYQADRSQYILLDKNKFEKILHNFLSNALKFTPPEGLVKLTIKEKGTNLIIKVKDTGPGIHPDDLPFVFDRFYQAKQTSKMEKGGTGIGLSLCKELAELLGGKVWVKSELGKGSSFYFEFPKKAVLGEVQLAVGSRQTAERDLLFELATPKTDKAVLPDTDQQANKSTILIIEDNQDLREYLKFLLSDYKVIAAENGKVGLDCLLQTANCQLIISDLMMPVMDGFEFLEKVKSDDRWRHIPVIMLTAKVNIKSKLNALRIGVDDYLNKPFEEEELKARIENLLRNYRERMLLFSQKDGSNIGMEEPESEASNLPVIAQADAKWLEEVEEVLNKFLPEYNLNMDRVAEELYISHRQFSRKLKRLTGLTASQYLQEMRLHKAKEVLLIGKYKTIKEVSFAVGFKDTRYFSDLFQTHFGIKASSHLR